MSRTALVALIPAVVAFLFGWHFGQLAKRCPKTAPAAVEHPVAYTPGQIAALPLPQRVIEKVRYHEVVPERVVQVPQDHQVVVERYDTVVRVIPGRAGLDTVVQYVAGHFQQVAHKGRKLFITVPHDTSWIVYTFGIRGDFLAVATAGAPYVKEPRCYLCEPSLVVEGGVSAGQSATPYAAADVSAAVLTRRLRVLVRPEVDGEGARVRLGVRLGT